MRCGAVWLSPSAPAGLSGAPALLRGAAWLPTLAARLLWLSLGCRGAFWLSLGRCGGLSGCLLTRRDLSGAGPSEGPARLVARDALRGLSGHSVLVASRRAAWPWCCALIEGPRSSGAPDVPRGLLWVPPTRRAARSSYPQSSRLSTALPTARRNCRCCPVSWKPGAGGRPGQGCQEYIGKCSAETAGATPTNISAVRMPITTLFKDVLLRVPSGGHVTAKGIQDR